MSTWFYSMIKISNTTEMACPAVKGVKVRMVATCLHFITAELRPQPAHGPMEWKRFASIIYLYCKSFTNNIIIQRFQD